MLLGGIITVRRACVNFFIIRVFKQTTNHLVLKNVSDSKKKLKFQQIGSKTNRRFKHLDFIIDIVWLAAINLLPQHLIVFSQINVC